MTEYAIGFEGRNNAININQLENTNLLKLFSGYSGQVVDMYRLVATLNNNGFYVNKIINNSNNTIYRIQSEQLNIVLNLSVSKDIQFQQKNKDRYLPTIKVLKAMSKNATVVNNNIINITNKDDKELQDAYKPNLQLIKGTKYNQNIKKFLKTTKGKIVLCTLIGGLIATGLYAGCEVNEIIKDNEFKEKYSTSQSYQFDESQKNDIYQAMQNGEIDTSLANPNEYYEGVKTEYNQENYQNVR